MTGNDLKHIMKQEFKKENRRNIQQLFFEIN